MRKKYENNFKQPRDLLNGQSDSPTKKNQHTLYPKDVDDEVGATVQSQIHATATLSVEEPLV